MNSLVSVIITTYYRDDQLRDAIESALAQSYEPIQVIVVDDSGESYAKPIVEDYDVKYVEHTENKGQIEGWHTGLKEAKGKYVQLLDDDDWLDKQKIARQVEVLDKNPDAGVAYCGLKFSDRTVVRPDSDVRGNILEKTLTLHFPPATTTSLLIERQVMEDVVPLYNHQAGCDIPLKIELARRTHYECVDDLLVYRSEDPDSQGKSKTAADTRWWVLDEYEELYESLPDSVRRQALATTLRFEGMIYWKKDGWSSRAIVDFARVLHVAPDVRFEDIVHLQLSLFGSVGLTIGRRIKEG